MKEFEQFDRDIVYSTAVRAGKRTYFFDVKQTKNGEKYLTITESKKRFDNRSGRFVFDKHKIFLYKEDFENFRTCFDEMLNFINTGEKNELSIENRIETGFEDIDFENLGVNKD